MSKFLFSSTKARIKKHDKDDLLLVIMPESTIAAGAFSTSAIISPTIDWDKESLKINQPRALIVNSGNANSFTGQHGIKAIEEIATALAKKFKIEKKQVFISSTGVIGEKLPYDKIINSLDELAKNLDENNLEHAAKAIMTTDTVPKYRIVKTKILDREVKIEAIAKGAGMAAPNLATVLSYFFTDAKFETKILEQIFKEAINETFNAFTIDGDMSTNDTVMIFASGAANNKIANSANAEILQDFKLDLKKLMQDICEDIVKDGEGVSKLCKIYISGAESKISAKNIAMSIANSPLVKTALNGSDPNWGRIVMAVGKAKEKINITKFSLAIGSTNIVKDGELNPHYDEHKSTAIYMKNNFIEIFVDVGLNNEKNQFIATTSDLSKGYIEINADYRS
jgi:glutamate N-acetyltransferase/amino-acid N-acetyltransferase